MNIDQLEKHRIELEKPLLIIKASQGLLACGYLNLETFNKTGEACALVTGVSNFDEMLTKGVSGVSSAAADLGVVVGMSGKDALTRMHKGTTEQPGI
ncbi:MAG: YunC family protein [Fuerstiella sp.]|nr:YunC family protein [Fuerstiella sp.]